MPTTFRPYGPDRLLLLVPDMHGRLPEGPWRIMSATWRTDRT